MRNQVSLFLFLFQLSNCCVIAQIFQLVVTNSHMTFIQIEKHDWTKRKLGRQFRSCLFRKLDRTRLVVPVWRIFFANLVLAVFTSTPVQFVQILQCSASTSDLVCNTSAMTKAGWSLIASRFNIDAPRIGKPVQCPLQGNISPVTSNKGKKKCPSSSLQN